MDILGEARRVFAIEIEAMQSTLTTIGKLEPSEAQLVVELATRQARFRAAGAVPKKLMFTEQQRHNFIDALNVIAMADGEVKMEEIQEIKQIANEYGFPTNKKLLEKETTGS